MHEGKTYAWGRDEGFTPNEARIVATEDEGMDHGWSNPFNPFGGTQQHFSDRGEVIDDLNNDIKKGNLKKFGQDLHSLQDTFSHQGYEWWKGGHLKDGHAPDKYNPNSSRDKAMEKWTRYFMEKYLEQNKKKPCP